MARQTLSLSGCTPTPLASYLKALGVLRLLSSAPNSVDRQAVDPQVRGWWANEQFHLMTTLNRDALLTFFLEKYAPSPIIAPWNGGSGFYSKDNKEGFEPLSSEIVAKRFEIISCSIRSASQIIKRVGLTKKPDGSAKVKLLELLRSEMPDTALDWIDAALVLAGKKAKYPQLLGTGGNDGRLDFTNNFMQRLVAKGGLFDASSGAPSEDAAKLLLSSLFDVRTGGLRPLVVGQFAPGPAGGPNASTGFGRAGNVNPWDFVLMLEGSVAFSGSATRRHQSTSAFGASFPFTVRAVGAGGGSVGVEDEQNARAEFWAPLWSKPTRFLEVNALLSEGRAVLNGRTVRDGLDFARAVTGLGTSRGFSQFERFGFFMRSGKAYFATPISRAATERSTGSRLLADLDTGGWLDRVRQVGRQKEESAAARNAIKQLEDALFELVAPSISSIRIERVLVAIGRVAAWLAVSPKGRDTVGMPPPMLSSAWVQEGDDGSAEFRVAAALAGLGLPFGTNAEASDLEQGSHEGSGGDSSNRGGESSDSAPDTRQRLLAVPPMAMHFAPVDEKQFARRRKTRRWANDATSAMMAWGIGSLVSNLISVLERRLVDMNMRGLADKPLAGATTAGLVDVATFLSGDFDDSRCSALLRGLIWANPVRLRRRERKAGDFTTVPFAYSALKPLFVPNEALRRVGVLASGEQMPVPPGLVARLRVAGGDLKGRQTNDAVQSALARTRATGLASPFADALSGARVASSRVGVGVRPDRLAAALLIPISDKALLSLLARAYMREEPDGSESTEDINDGD